MTPGDAGDPLGFCPTCNCKDRSLFLQKGVLTLFGCNACQLIYSDPQPRALVERLYLREYDLAAHFGRFEERKLVLYARRLDALPDPGRGCDRLCDVGCGDGQFMAAAAARGWRPVGVELNPPAAAHARSRGFEVVEGRLETAVLPRDAFDVVTAWDSLEHTPDPAAFLARMVALGRPGGMIALTTLNVHALVGRILGTRWSMITPDHFTYWHDRPLRIALERAGTAVGETATFGLGRDLVRPFENAVSSLRRRRPAASPSSSVANGDQAARSWDARPLLTGLEDLANVAFDRAGLGVGIWATAVRR